MTHPPAYPAMSHPSADPAVNAVAARLLGLEAADPSRAAILELGCGSGHHLLPLAARWPDAEFVGIDQDPDAIGLARELAAEAGLANVDFRIADLEDTEGKGSFDFVIAHGVFSWVPDAVKLALLRQVAANLAARGVAVVSFNVAAGWRTRMPLIAKARAIQQAGDDVDLIRALEILRDVCENDSERVIVDDMRGKGRAVLAHDDFAPVCDPMSLVDFASLAAHHGLRWLGEGVPADNLPVGGAEVDPSAFSNDPVAMHHALDEAGGRTFRSAMLCRAELDLPVRMSTAVVSGCFIAPGKSRYEGDAALMRELEAAAPGDLIAGAIIERLGPAFAARIVEGIYQGAITARTHPAVIMNPLPERPRLDELRLACARRRLPIVDARHVPCQFPDAQYPLLAMMDGTRRVAELEQAAPTDLAFHSWMKHLAERGILG